MKHSLGLATLLGLGLIASASESRASDWVHGPTLQRYTGNAVTASRAFLVDPGANLRLGQLDLVHSTTLPLRTLQTVRFEQRYAGLPVIGKSVAVRIATDGTVRTAVIDVARNLSVSPVPAVDANAAIARVEAMLGRSAPGATAALAVLPQDDQGGLLVWQVDSAWRKGLYRFVVDANMGTVMFHHPVGMDALGRVYDVNWVKTPSPADRELPALVPSTPQNLTGFEGRMGVYGYVSGDVSTTMTAAQNTEPNTGEDFLYDPSSNVQSLVDPFGEVNAFYHCGRMEEYFSTKHGVDMTSSAWSLSIVTSYAPASSPEYIDNAFYTPGGGGVSVPGSRKNLIAIGRGTQDDFAYDSDVFLHEYTHYVNHNAVNFSGGAFDFDQYGLVVMPGAINEGTADYFSSTINDDSVVGEATLGAYARDLAAPAGRCPDTVYGESHEDGKLIGTASWAIREALGADLGDQLVWGAVSLLTQSATLGDFGKGVVQTAQDLDLSTAQLGQINTILAERGLDDCGRVLDLHPGEARKTTMFGLEAIGQMMGASCSQMKNYGISLSSIFHFKHIPGASDKGVNLSVSLDKLMGTGPLDWSIYARKGAMVTFTSSGGYQPPDPSVFDYVVESFTGNDGSLTIDASSDPPFDPASDYYFVIVHKNCPVEAVSIESTSIMDLPVDAGVDSAVEPEAGTDATVEPEADAEVVVDAGADGPAISADGSTLPPAATGSDDDGGCGCSTPASQTSAGAGALMALGLALSVARRRRSRS